MSDVIKCSWGPYEGPLCAIFQRALLSLYWPTGLAWSSILKIKKHTYAFWDLLTFCCRDFGLTCSILKRILWYRNTYIDMHIYTHIYIYKLWVDMSWKWAGGWVRFNQETNCTGLAETIKVINNVTHGTSALEDFFQIKWKGLHVKPWLTRRLTRTKAYFLMRNVASGFVAVSLVFDSF